MTEVEQYVAEMEPLLNEAYLAAAGKPAEQQRVLDWTDQVKLIYTRYLLSNLQQAANRLNELSSVVDGLIGDLKSVASNFMMARLVSLKGRIDHSTSAALGEVCHPSAVAASADPAPPAAAVSPSTMDDADYAAHLARLFKTMALRDGWPAKADWVIDRFIEPRNRARYARVEAATGVPWWVTAVIHSLETGVNFGLHLHNGDPLTARTTHAPPNRPPASAGNPPFDWTVSAVDALTMDSHALDHVTDWSLPNLLLIWERFNGPGYRERGVNSPYLWSGSTHYSKGKFTTDHHYDPEAVSRQVGAAVLLRRMVDRKIVALEPAGAAIGAAAAPAAVVPLAPASIGPIGLLPLDLSRFKHAVAELDFPGEIKAGSASRTAVRRVQEWCSHHGFATAIDGAFGAGTASRVAQFQASRQLLATGVVDEATWLHLTLPMRRALQPVAPKDGGLYPTVIAVALQHLKEHPAEYGGNNRGPWVRLYMAGADGIKQLWCAGFVSFMIAQAARDMGIPLPIPRQVGVDALVADAKKSGRFVPETALPNAATRRAKLRPGALFVRRKSASDWDHTGLVLDLADDHFTTIEGNAAIGDSHDGTAATSRTRWYKNYDFVLLA